MFSYLLLILLHLSFLSFSVKWPGLGETAARLPRGAAAFSSRRGQAEARGRSDEQLRLRRVGAEGMCIGTAEAETAGAEGMCIGATVAEMERKDNMCTERDQPSRTSWLSHGVRLPEWSGSTLHSV